MLKEKAEELIKGFKDIPTLPDIVLKVNQALSNNSITLQVIEGIIEKDAALAAKVLRLANSSYYGLSQNVDTITRAITVLGFNTVRTIAVTASVSDIYNKKTFVQFDAKGLWHHGLGCAIASKALVYKTDEMMQEKTFVCGLLHDIGKIIITLNLPEQFNRALKKLREDSIITQSEAEEEALGFTHAEIGALIAEKWHFPKDISEIIRFHHSPYAATKLSLSNEDLIILNAVYAGNQLSKTLKLGKSTDDKTTPIETHTWSAIGITEQELPEIIDRIRSNFEIVINSWRME